jgi:type I restriction enzyme S subunit
LNAFLNSPVGQESVQAQSRTTSGLRTLSVGRINKIQVPVPSLESQCRIVTSVEEIQSKISTLRDLQRDSCAEVDALIPSILDKAFRGEM